MKRSKKLLSVILCSLLAVTLLPSSSFAKPKDSVNTIKGTWSRGIETVDPIAEWEGERILPDGTKEKLDVSPFTDTNVIDSEDIKTKNSGGVSANNYWSNSSYFEYIAGSYAPTSSKYDAYHYKVGETQGYNATKAEASLSYTQSESVTSQWAVTAQISATAELKTNYLAKLGTTFSTTFAKSTTTTSSTSVLWSIKVPSGYTGWITAHQPGGYSTGTAKFTEYFYNSYTGTFTKLGTISTTQSGWSPKANSLVTFKSGVKLGV